MAIKGSGIILVLVWYRGTASNRCFKVGPQHRSESHTIWGSFITINETFFDLVDTIIICSPVTL